MEQKLTSSMHSRAPAVGAMLLASLAVLVLAPSSMPSAMAQSANGVKATYNHYDAPSKNWDLTAVSASCAPLYKDAPIEWRSYYWWAAFCGPAGPRGDAACGRCLQVTNVATGKTNTVRIVDDCSRISGGASLAIDTVGFLEIDDDPYYHGFLNGYIEANYQFVDCQG